MNNVKKPFNSISTEQKISWLIVGFFVGLILTNFQFSVSINNQCSVDTLPDSMNVQINNSKDVHIHKKVKYSYRGNLAEFMNRIAHFESNNDASVTNQYGYMGKYQFSMNTLKQIGFDVTKSEFLNNEDLQDSAMITLMNVNYKALQPIIKKYDGKYYNNILITTSGILAGAHLAGVGGILSYFNPSKYNYNTTDLNGATVELYLKKFSKYRIKL